MFLPAALSLAAVHLLTAPAGLVVPSTSPNTAAAVTTSSILLISSLLGCGFGSNLRKLLLSAVKRIRSPRIVTSCCLSFQLRSRRLPSRASRMLPFWHASCQATLPANERDTSVTPRYG